MLNQIVLMGRLTKDPELRKANSGITVAGFTLAVDRDYQKDQTDFIDITAWRKTAEFVGKWFHKGQMMALSGRLQVESWTDKDGNKRRSYEVVADNVYFTGKKEPQSGYPDAPKGYQDQPSAYQPGYTEGPPQTRNYTPEPDDGFGGYGAPGENQSALDGFEQMLAPDLRGGYPFGA